MLKTPSKKLNRLLLFTMSLNAACSVAPRPFEAPASLPDSFSQTGKAELRNRWWLNFNDPVLDRLIETALQQNLDLRATFNRLEQAKAVARKTGSELIPEISGNSGIDRIISSPAQGQRTTTDTFSLGLAASYELDLWGRIRAGTQAAEQDVKASALDIQTAAIALSAEIASTWYRLIEQNKQLKLLNQQIETNTQNVDIVAARFRGGQATVADLFQQSQVLEAVRGDQYTVIATIEVLKNQLAVLTGQSPGMIRLDSASQFPKLPELPVTGLTADLIQRRPDILSAYRRLQAADLRIAAAVADRFPKISLSGSIDTTAPDLQDFFNNWLATLAGNLVIPLIDGGRRIAEVDRTRAVTEEALNAYGQRILRSLEEVENALIQESQQHKRLDSLEKQLRFLDEANNQIRMRYIYGAMDFLRVLTSQVSQQSLQRSVIQAERELINFRIALYRSLAGGWTLTQPVNHESQTDG
ncbi:MAG: efflux transporter outer membrane subunit [Gammaproteobacteria bacterium]